MLGHVEPVEEAWWGRVGTQSQPLCLGPFSSAMASLCFLIPHLTVKGTLGASLGFWGLGIRASGDISRDILEPSVSQWAFRPADLLPPSLLSLGERCARRPVRPRRTGCCVLCPKVWA